MPESLRSLMPYTVTDLRNGTYIMAGRHAFYGDAPAARFGHALGICARFPGGRIV